MPPSEVDRSHGNGRSLGADVCSLVVICGSCVPNEVVSGMRLSALAFPPPISYVKWPADSSCIACGRSFSTSPRAGAREDVVLLLRGHLGFY